MAKYFFQPSLGRKKGGQKEILKAGKIFGKREEKEKGLLFNAGNKKKKEI
jgi:hypothetical protein